MELYQNIRKEVKACQQVYRVREVRSLNDSDTEHALSESWPGSRLALHSDIWRKFGLGTKQKVVI